MQEVQGVRGNSKDSESSVLDAELGQADRRSRHELGEAVIDIETARAG
jgi:hypothetical protein